MDVYKNLCKAILCFIPGVLLLSITIVVIEILNGQCHNTLGLTDFKTNSMTMTKLETNKNKVVILAAKYQTQHYEYWHSKSRHTVSSTKPDTAKAKVCYKWPCV